MHNAAEHTAKERLERKLVEALQGKPAKRQDCGPEEERGSSDEGKLPAPSAGSGSDGVGRGGSVATYKELCSMATTLGTLSAKFVTVNLN